MATVRANERQHGPRLARLRIPRLLWRNDEMLVELPRETICCGQFELTAKNLDIVRRYSSSIFMPTECAHKNPLCAMTRETRSAGSLGGGKSSWQRVLRNVPNEVTCFRMAVRIQSRMSMVAGS